MRVDIIAAAAACLFCPAVIAGSAHAAMSLQVAPVLVEIQAPAATGQVTLRNPGTGPLSAQVRVFRWVQKDGNDQLIETRDVVASPPIVEIGPQAEQLVRIVRLAKMRPEIEESYRLLVDEIPAQPGTGNSGVAFAIRYSVPVFFGDGKLASTPLLWSVQQKNGKAIVSARNTGLRRERIAGLRLISDRGDVVLSKGLVGYVLAQSTASWTFPVRLEGFKIGDPVRISGRTDQGAIAASAILQGGK